MLNVPPVPIATVEAEPNMENTAVDVELPEKISALGKALRVLISCSIKSPSQEIGKA